MTNVTQGNTATVDIAVGDSIQVRAGAETKVSYLTGTPDSGYATRRMMDGEAVVFGPFGSAAQISVEAVAGTSVYRAAPAQDYGVDHSSLTLNKAEIRGSQGDWCLLTGSGAPAISAQAAAVLASAGANNDLTFTAVGYGADGNSLSVKIVQATALSTALGVAITGDTDYGDWLATITLPSDGAGDPVAKTANQVKTAWDAVAAAVGVVTVAVEGSGAGNVAAHVVELLFGGTGVGPGFAGKGSKYIDLDSGDEYNNTGTLAQPAWTQLAFVA